MGWHETEASLRPSEFCSNLKIINLDFNKKSILNLIKQNFNFVEKDFNFGGMGLEMSNSMVMWVRHTKEAIKEDVKVIKAAE